MDPLGQEHPGGSGIELASLARPPGTRATITTGTRIVKRIVVIGLPLTNAREI